MVHLKAVSNFVETQNKEDLSPYINGHNFFGVKYLIDDGKLFPEADFFKEIEGYYVYANQRQIIYNSMPASDILADVIASNYIPFTVNGDNYELYPLHRLDMVKSDNSKISFGKFFDMHIEDGICTFIYKDGEFNTNGTQNSAIVRVIPHKTEFYKKKANTIPGEYSFFIFSPKFYQIEEEIYLKFIKKEEIPTSIKVEQLPNASTISDVPVTLNYNEEKNERSSDEVKQVDSDVPKEIQSNHLTEEF